MKTREVKAGWAKTKEIRKKMVNTRANDRVCKDKVATRWRPWVKIERSRGSRFRDEPEEAFISIAFCYSFMNPSTDRSLIIVMEGPLI